MPRRAVKRIDPSLNLSNYLLQPEDLPRPFSTLGLFGRDAPLEVEVGTGKGLFLMNAAEAVSEHLFLGCEVSHKYARFSAGRLARREVANAKVLDGDGLWLFREVLPAGCAAAVHVYFPDPWWKKRHHKRRVMSDAFVRNIERVLKPADGAAAGVLHFWTDVKEYFDVACATLEQHTALHGPLEVPEKPPEHDLDYRTNFERKKRQAGHPIYRAEFHRT